MGRGQSNGCACLCLLQGFSSMRCSLLTEVCGVDEELLGFGSCREHNALPRSWPWEAVNCSCP